MLPAGVLICLLTACQSESPAPGPGPAPPAPPPFSVPPGLSPALTSMLQGLPAYLTQALQANQDLLPRNPQSTSFVAPVPEPQKAQVSAKLARVMF